MRFTGNCPKEADIDTSKLTGYDYRMFHNSPAWCLAQAVRDDDTATIKKIIQSGKIPVDFQIPEIGITLLLLAVRNQNYNSAMTLLELGADPNHHDLGSGTSPMINSAGVDNQKGDGIKFLKLMLSYGGNPNDEEVGPRPKGNNLRNSPLLEACSYTLYNISPLEKVKLLVEAGADINHKNEFETSTPLNLAVTMKHYDVVLYLLAKGAVYTNSTGEFNGRQFYITDDLRFGEFPLDSKKYQDKMKVVAFLKQKGMDYTKVPIPKIVIERAQRDYPNNWQEYLEKY